MNTAEVMWGKMPISHITQLNVNIGSVTLIECQEACEVYLAKVIAWFFESRGIDRASISQYMIS